MCAFKPDVFVTGLRMGTSIAVSKMETAKGEDRKYHKSSNDLGKKKEGGIVSEK
jgi:hypothetical protein